jgi:uncharacterized integral membrane protein (TIGR00698 family)
MVKKFFQNEDWLSFSAGLLIIVLAVIGIQFSAPKFGWASISDLTKLLSSSSNLLSLSLTAIVIFILGFATKILRAKSNISIIISVLLILLLSFASQLIAGFKPIKYYGFEYVIFALLLGIFIRSVFGLPKWLEANLHTEFFVKTGLVILGAGIIFGDILSAGSLGLIQAVVVVVSVWFFAFWVGGKLKIDEELRLMLASAVSICGVSAAIATAGAINGDSKKLSYVVSLVLIVALPMLILLPLAATWLGLNPAQAGAWMGGTIDTTGAVVASGSILGEVALKYCTIVKFSQNVLIGFAAVGISVFWAFKNKNTDSSVDKQKVDFKLIWERFPKFVLGFIIASVLFSFVVSAEMVSQTKDYLKGIQTAFFALAFVSIGLETDFSVLLKTGNGRPAWTFIIAQSFNIVFTLILAWFLFANIKQ